MNKQPTLQIKNIKLDTVNSSPRQLFDLAKNFEYGGVPFEKNPEAAYEIYKYIAEEEIQIYSDETDNDLAAQKMKGSAVNSMGWICLNYFPAPDNKEKAIELFMKAAKLNNTTAMVNLGNIYEDEEKYELALKWYQDAALYGDSKGMFNYANMFFHGWGVEPDYEKAHSFFESAAFNDDAAAYYYLGLYEEQGILGEPDYKKAAAYYKKGVELKDAFSANNLATLYATGKGVPYDYDLALHYYKYAIELGDPLGYANAGWLLENDSSKSIDYCKAVSYYIEGASHGNQESLNNLLRLTAVPEDEFSEEMLPEICNVAKEKALAAHKIYWQILTDVAVNCTSAENLKLKMDKIMEPTRQVNSFDEIIEVLNNMLLAMQENSQGTS